MSEKKNLERGDVAALVSGGPDMTVVKVAPAKAAVNSAPPVAATEESIECWWFNDDDKFATLQKAEFHPASVIVKKAAKAL